MDEKIIYLIKIIGGSIVLGIIIGVGLSFFINPVEHNYICYDFKTLNETLLDIEENCGDTYITKKYGEDDWSIFTIIEKDNGFKKYDYIKLEDCLNKK